MKLKLTQRQIIMKKIFNIKITEEGLNTIMKALECYSRLGINQFTYCLEHNPKFKELDWDDKREIEDYLRHKIDSRGLGIYHPEVAKFNEAFQIKKEIEKNIAISKEPVMKHMSNSYDGALSDYEYIPRFYDDSGNKVEHQIIQEIPEKHQEKLKNLGKKKDFEGLWRYVDKHLKIGVRGNATRISDDYTQVVIVKPYELVKNA